MRKLSASRFRPAVFAAAALLASGCGGGSDGTDEPVPGAGEETAVPVSPVRDGTGRQNPAAPGGGTGVGGGDSAGGAEPGGTERRQPGSGAGEPGPEPPDAPVDAQPGRGWAALAVERPDPPEAPKPDPLPLTGFNYSPGAVVDPVGVTARLRRTADYIAENDRNSFSMEVRLVLCPDGGGSCAGPAVQQFVYETGRGPNPRVCADPADAPSGPAPRRNCIWAQDTGYRWWHTGEWRTEPEPAWTPGGARTIDPKNWLSARSVGAGLESCARPAGEPLPEDGDGRQTVCGAWATGAGPLREACAQVFGEGEERTAELCVMLLLSPILFAHAIDAVHWADPADPGLDPDLETVHYDPKTGARFEVEGNVPLPDIPFFSQQGFPPLPPVRFTSEEALGIPDKARNDVTDFVNELYQGTGKRAMEAYAEIDYY